MKKLELLRYPIGKFTKPITISENQLQKWISEIEIFPSKLKVATENLSISDLQLEYRPNGWNIKQVVHHCADSHMNSFIRFKLALTEENPTIKPYEEQLWAEMKDGFDDDISPSISILQGVHNRWILLLKSLNYSQFNRTFYHPESKQNISLSEATGIYAWHCNHHFAHIQQAILSKTIFKKV